LLALATRVVPAAAALGVSALGAAAVAALLQGEFRAGEEGG
jgi:hypothetical protein